MAFDPTTATEFSFDPTTASEVSTLSVTKGTAGEAAAIAGVITGFPEFFAATVGTPIQAVGQMVIDGTVNWEKAAKDARRIASPLSMLKTPVDIAVKDLGLEEEYQQSKITQGLESLGKGIEWVATKLEENTGIPKASTVASLDVAMLGIGLPGVKPIYRAIEKRIAPDLTVSATKPIVTGKDVVVPDRSATSVVSTTPKVTEISDQYIKDTLETPEIPFDNKGFSDSLYSLDNITKKDTTDVINLKEKLKEENISVELEQKFQRFDEGQALGNEKINNDIYEVNKKLNEIYSDNQALFKEGDYRSVNNPEGATAWKDFVYKDEVRTNYERIEALKKEKELLEAKRGTREALSPAEFEIYQKYYEPMRTEIRRLTEYAEKESIVAPFGKDVDFASRKSMFNPKEKSIWESYKEAAVGKDFTEQRRSVANVADAGEQRTYFVLEDAKGKREVVTIVPTEKGTVITPIRNKALLKDKATFVPKEVSTLTGDKILGKTIREATVAELELNTGTTYAKDYSLVMGERLTDLREQIRIHEWSKDLISNPANKDFVFKPKNPYDKIPEGFRQLQYSDRMPKLREYYFDRRMAEMLDDFNKPIEQTRLTKFNNGLVTNMMLVPIAHMHNELFHWGVTRGVTGIANPVRLATMLRTMGEATREVLGRGDFYRQVLAEGGSIMSANVKNNSYIENAYQQSLNQFSKRPEFKDIAKAMAVSPATLYKNISKMSNTSMWTVRDILYVQLLKEKVDKGMPLKEAIYRVERHMPNYRLPSRLISDSSLGRGLSLALGNRNAFLFARYHAGMVGSTKNILQDVAMLEDKRGKPFSIQLTDQTKGKVGQKKERLMEGLDSAMAFGIAMSVLYPWLDSMAEVVSETIEDITGGSKINKSKVRRAGAAHVLETVADVYKGEKDPYALSSILVTMTPALQMVIEIPWNKEIYNSKEVVTLGADPEVISDQYFQYLLRKVPQANQALQATNEDYGTGLAGAVLRNFFDIKTQTRDQIQRIEDQVERKQTEAKDLNRSYGREKGSFLFPILDSMSDF